MQYMLLIHGDEQGWAALSEDARDGWMEKWGAYVTELREKGAMVGGEQLQPTSTATTVQIREGAKPLVTDGPYAETKEQLGGYFLIEVETVDEALEWAGKIPHGTVEVRPVLPMRVESSSG